MSPLRAVKTACVGCVIAFAILASVGAGAAVLLDVMAPVYLGDCR